VGVLDAGPEASLEAGDVVALRSRVLDPRGGYGTAPLVRGPPGLVMDRWSHRGKIRRRDPAGYPHNGYPLEVVLGKPGTPGPAD